MNASTSPAHSLSRSISYRRPNLKALLTCTYLYLFHQSFLSVLLENGTVQRNTLWSGFIARDFQCHCQFKCEMYVKFHANRIYARLFFVFLTSACPNGRPSVTNAINGRKCPADTFYFNGVCCFNGHFAPRTTKRPLLERRTTPGAVAGGNSSACFCLHT